MKDLSSDLNSYLNARQNITNEINSEQFSNRDEELSARTNPSIVDRSKHMKAAVVDNQDRLLNRTVSVSNSNTQVTFFNAAEERIKNLETHLGIVVAPVDRDLYSRIRAVEEKILKIELHYPQIAAHCFNYGKMEKEASSRPGGRVSKFDFSAGGSVKKIKKQPSIQDLRSKMANLKEKLTRKEEK